jgi:phenylalanyl-tRNA synthetase alpha subunit
MSFTEDELQAFNTILERRLSVQRREMEHAFEQRMNALRRSFDERLATAQQEIIRALTRQLSNQHNELNTSLNQKLSAQQKQIDQTMSQQAEHDQQIIESLMDRALAAQLLGIEQLISQRMVAQAPDEAGTGANELVSPQRLEAIEVQAELPWEDLEDVLNKVLDARFEALNESIQTTMKSWEQFLLVRLHNLSEQTQTYNGDISSATTTQELIRGIEHLERIIESMQVVMTSNHALLSNRLYHHQQLPLERAHPASHTTHTSNTRSTPVNGVSDPLALPGERGREEN